MVDNLERNLGYKSLFYKIFFITLSLKLFLALFFPLTGDEAYFITTGKKFSLGYYEHPPFIWWYIYLISLLSKNGLHFFYYRLFSVFTTCIVSFLFLKLINNDEKSYLLSSLFLLTPIHLLGFLITNDVPLFLFIFISAFFFYKGIKEERRKNFVFSGFFFGLSFLSKYFAVLYFLSILVYIILKNEKKFYFNFLIFLVFSLPFIFLNLYWNYTHCWINILFNLVYRKKISTFQLKNLVLFFLSLAFLLTPYSFYLFIKKKLFLFSENEIDKFLVLLYVIPLFFFFIISFFRTVGLHWYISFIPFILIMFKNLEKEIILKNLRVSVAFEILIILPVIILLCLPPSIFKNQKNYSEIIMFLKGDSIWKYLKNYENDYILATTNYTDSAIMSYYSNRNFIVFGSLDHSGRQYDFTFDFKEIAGKNILIFSPRSINEEEFKIYFENIKRETFTIEEATFYLLFCKKFNYEIYRETILKKTYEKFYKIPDFLPAKGNFFKEKYNF
ncbi:MAG: glycosyltransferase family 39 protein [Candidatus Omnitrophica bacterium]|nr:glycosyltransferase family 39 protein [Candidatus Omnitrophota bacterium]